MTPTIKIELPLKIELPFDLIADLVKQIVEARVADHLLKTPHIDYHYSVAEVAKVFDMKEPTVRGYFDLPLNHRRRLPYVDMTGYARGRRVLASDMAAWQQRNRPDSLPIEIPVRRSARRQP